MKLTAKFLVFALLFSLGVAAQAEAAKRKHIKKAAVIQTHSGQVVTIYNKGVVVEFADDGEFQNCIEFCGAVCDVGTAATCFCDAQSFPCEDFGALPPISTE